MIEAGFRKRRGAKETDPVFKKLGARPAARGETRDFPSAGLGRSAEARRYRDITGSLAADLGGDPDNLSGGRTRGSQIFRYAASVGDTPRSVAEGKGRGSAMMPMMIAMFLGWVVPTPMEVGSPGRRSPSTTAARM
jgi:hypothetical protein